MNVSPLLMIAIAALIGVAIGATTVIAQKPGDYADETTCDSRAIKEYLAATNPDESERQEWHIRAAESYQALQEMGFTEC
jgi:glutathione S-transferase